MNTERRTVAQALVAFLAAQQIEVDGVVTPFFAGCLGIFGHGNLAGVGQALQQQHGTPGGLRYVQARNEQAMVHTAVAYARHRRRHAAWACTSSIGPGATNMVTGAATATINRIPVLLLPGDTFATREVDPVLQQLEHPMSPDITVNDCLEPVSRLFTRVHRPEQLQSALLAAMHVLTSPQAAGAVTICLPQDVQAEAFDFDPVLWEPRIWHVDVAGPATTIDAAALRAMLEDADRPVIVCGGGTRYSGAESALAEFVEHTGYPVVETQAGKGALAFDHPRNLGACGATGTSAANTILANADLVIGVGTGWDDFTSASRTALADVGVQVLNINVDPTDARKMGGVPLVADARVGLRLLLQALLLGTGADDEDAIRIDDVYARHIAELKADWQAEVERLVAEDTTRALPSQAEVVGVVNAAALAAEEAGRGATVVCAAGSLPGDLHKLWHTRDPLGYHVEYGYSCMGYEVAGGFGVAMADPGRHTIVMVGDGSWLMMSSEIATAVQEGVGFTVVLIDNHGFGSIGALSTSLGSDGFGTRWRVREGDGVPGGDGGWSGEPLPIDLVANAQSLGARAVRCASIADLRRELEHVDAGARVPTVLVIETDPTIGVPSYESWWNVPVAAVSEMDEVQAARRDWESQRERERSFL